MDSKWMCHVQRKLTNARTRKGPVKATAGKKKNYLGVIKELIWQKQQLNDQGGKSVKKIY